MDGAANHPSEPAQNRSSADDDRPTIFVIVAESWRRARLTEQLSCIQAQAEFFASPDDYFRIFDELRSGCVIFDAPSAGHGLEPHRRLNSSLVPPIIYITGDSDAAIVVEIMKNGAFEFLSRRTYDDAELLDAVRRALDRDHELRMAARQLHERRTRLKSLSQADRDVLRRLLAGENNAAIAASLGITEAAVEGRRLRLMRKLGVKNFPMLIRFVIESGLEAEL